MKHACIKGLIAVIGLAAANALAAKPPAPGSFANCEVLSYSTSKPSGGRRLLSTSSTGETVETWVVRSTANSNQTYAVRRTMKSSGEISMCAYAPNRVLATLVAGKSYATFEQEMAAKGLTVVRELMRDLDGNAVYVIEAAETENDIVEQMTMSIESTGSCSLVRPDHIYEANAVPNDTYYSSQWALEKIGAPQAWDTRTDASSVLVAVLDTGVNYNHYDLNRSMWINSGEILGDGIDNDGNGFVDDIYGMSCIGGNVSGDSMDDNGHGSHCAGIIGAAGNNRQWVSGVTWRAKIMGLKFLNSDGKGSVSDAITCLCYAEMMGVKVINCSFGSTDWDDYLYVQMKKMSQHGTIFVCAAGNAEPGLSPRDNDEYPFYPCNYSVDTLVSVAASDENDALANFSYYGAQNVDIAAPGVNINSTVLGTYGLDYKDGTSMATPHVTGALALLMAHYPGETSLQIIDRLYAAAEPVPALAGRVRTGARLSMAGFFGIPAPVEISVTQGSIADAVVLYWTAVNSGSHYRVWRAASEGGEKTMLCDWQQGLTFSDETAEPGATYWYYLQAAASIDGASASTYSIGVSGFRPEIDTSRITVSFDPAGGTVSPASKVYRVGETYDAMPVPTCSGKAFLGWFTDASGGTRLGEPSIVRAEATTLYAHWVASDALRVENLFARQRYPWNGYVDVTFDLYGVPEEDTASVSLTAQEEGVGSPLALRTFVGPAPTNLVNGAQHVVWDATPDTQGILYTNMILAATVSIDAKRITIRFNSNGGTGTMDDLVTMYGTAVNLPSNDFTRANHTFAGWATSAGGSVVYADGASVNNLAATQGAVVNLYAVWELNGPIWTIDERGTLTAVDLNGYTDIIIPGTVKSIGENVFFNCTSLSSVTMPNGVTNIEAGAFFGCSGLTSIVLPASVANVGRNAFAACDGITGISVATANANYTSQEGVLYDKAITTLIACPGAIESVVIPDTVTNIGNSAFYKSAALKNVTIPESVTNIGSSAFGYCYKLSSVSIPGSVKDIRSFAFFACITLADLTIGDGVERIWNNAFADCRNLENVTIPQSVRTIGLGAFMECDSLTSVIILGALDSYSYDDFFYLLTPESLMTHVTALWRGPADTWNDRPVAFLKHTITFNANGGSGAMASQQVVWHATSNLTANAFTRSGYAFVGWATSASGSVAYANGASVTPSADMTLYAKWTESAPTLADAVDNTALTFTTGGYSSWIAQSTYSHDGVDAARSGTLGNSKTNWLQTTVSGTGSISFWWYASSEANYDYLEFLVDGTLKSSISGTNNVWTLKSFDIGTSGTHTLMWRYRKDGSVDKGLDAGFVDQVTWTGSATVSHDKVQLWEGGPYWATTNIGAENPEDCGYYFWWGDTVGYKREGDAWVASDGSPVIYSAPTDGKSFDALESEGWVTADKNALAPEHDAAHVQWGGAWRMPTTGELYNLASKCDWTWTAINGISGYVICGRDDYASNSIFLPAAGNVTMTSLCLDGLRGYYWSSSASSSSDTSAWMLTFTSSDHNANYLSSRGCWQSIRPVQGNASSDLYLVMDLSGGASAASYPVTYMAAPPSGGFNTDEYKTTKLVLRRIEPGSFEMSGWRGVTITKPFYCGIFEVTQRQYELVTGSRPSYFKNAQCYATRPVENVSWETARGNPSVYNWPSSRSPAPSSFIGKIQAKTGLALDLPTEAQWEYACHAGTTGEFNNGQSGESAMASLGRYMDNSGAESTVYDTWTDDKGTAKVGSYQPNNWGLYDMHGNVLEWCLDWAEDLQWGLGDDIQDPEGPLYGSQKIARGGNFSSPAASCSAYNRWYMDPMQASYPCPDEGFRLVGNLSEE